MKDSWSVKDIIVVVVAWLIAAGIVYLAFMKFKIFFHN